MHSKSAVIALAALAAAPAVLAAPFPYVPYMLLDKTLLTAFCRPRGNFIARRDYSSGVSTRYVCFVITAL